MLRLVLSLALLLTALPATAQITLTADDVAGNNFGLSFISQNFFVQNPNPATLQALLDLSGDDQVWDFTVFSYDPNDPSRNTFVSPPDGLPGSDDPAFAQANYAVSIDFPDRSPDLPDSLSWTFHRLEEDGHYDLGAIIDYLGTQTRSYYDEPYLSLALPLTIGTTWTEDAVLTQEFPGVGTFAVTISETSVVDGYGTLVTPAGTEPCLRVRIERTATSNGTATTVIIYLWLTQTDLAASATSVPGPNGNTLTALYSVTEGEGGGGTSAPTAAPANLSPEDGATGQDSALSLGWEAVDSATGYDVQVADNDAFTKTFTLLVDEQNLTGLSYEVTGLDQGATYFWRVRARNSAGTGPWSETHQFMTATGVGLERLGDAIPQTLVLNANYPNPFNPTTAIRFDLPQAGTVQLLVYDLAGREVARLVDQPLPAGTHQVTFDATGLPSGTYLYRLRTNTAELTRPMTLVK